MDRNNLGNIPDIRIPAILLLTIVGILLERYSSKRVKNLLDKIDKKSRLDT